MADEKAFEETKWWIDRRAVEPGSRNALVAAGNIYRSEYKKIMGSPREKAPDEVIDAVTRLPAGPAFSRTGDVVRALGIPTEQDR